MIVKNLSGSGLTKISGKNSRKLNKKSGIRSKHVGRKLIDGSERCGNMRGMMTEDRLKKLSAWLESKEGQEAIKKLRETLKEEHKKMEESLKADPDALKKPMDCF